MESRTFTAPSANTIRARLAYVDSLIGEMDNFLARIEGCINAVEKSLDSIKAVKSYHEYLCHEIGDRS
jgi:hypothetical protein